MTAPDLPVLVQVVIALAASLAGGAVLMFAIAWALDDLFGGAVSLFVDAFKRGRR